MLGDERAEALGVRSDGQLGRKGRHRQPLAAQRDDRTGARDGGAELGERRGDVFAAAGERGEAAQAPTEPVPVGEQAVVEDARVRERRRRHAGGAAPRPSPAARAISARRP